MTITKTIAAVAALCAGTLAFTGTAEAKKWHHHHHGYAVGAGVAGFAAGAIVGSALAQPRYNGVVVVEPSYGYSDWIAYCSARYRSFNPHTGLYVGYDGRYHRFR
jgi:hypothetical protein